MNIFTQAVSTTRNIAREATSGALPLLLLAAMLATGMGVSAVPGNIGSVAAATVYYVSGDTTIGSDSNPCTQAAPCASIGHAIAGASSGDTIDIAGSDTTFNGVYCEQIWVTKTLTLEAEDPANVPIIDGGDAGPPCSSIDPPGYSVLRVGDAGATAIAVTLQSLIIQHGTNYSNPSDGYNGPGKGGGVFVYAGATLTLTGSTVSGNYGCSNTPCTSGYGGGIDNDGTIRLVNSTVTGNYACVYPCSTSGYAGGIYNLGAATLMNSTVSGNNACTNCQDNLAYGGGVYNHSGATLTLTNATISGNAACTSCLDGSGGGIYNAGGTTTLTGSTAAGNSACHSCSAGVGGGIDNDSGTTTLASSTVSGNVACEGCSGSPPCCGGYPIDVGGAGGGMTNDGTLALTNSTVNGNTGCDSSDCGGPYASGFGGGINADSGTTTLTNTTVSGNTTCASSCTGTDTGAGTGGGGVHTAYAASTTLTNTILAGNGDPAGTPDCSGSLSDGSPQGTTVGDNIVGDGDGCGLSNGSNGDQVGTGGSPIDAKLAGLQSNGGPTQTLAPLPGSPATGSGDPTTCSLTKLANGAPGPNGQDQRGAPRPSASCDVGAYQAIPITYAATNGNDSNNLCLSVNTPCRHIAAALARVAPGGSVDVAAGVYCEQLLVDKAVTLLGTGSTAVVDGGAGSGDSCASIDLPGHSVLTVGDALATAMSVTLQGLTIQNGDDTQNAQYPGFGGGIFVYPGVTLSVAMSTITGNTACSSSACNFLAGNGGGIASLGATTVTNSTLSGNVACSGACTSAGEGGGMYSHGATTVTDSTVSGNVACNTACSYGGQGGGMYVYGGTANLANSTISNNTGCAGTCTSAGEGGGMYVYGGTANLANTTISGNSACGGSCSTGAGGGIVNNSGSTTLTNTILALNGGASGSPDCSGSPADGTVGDNIIGDATGCGFTSGTGDQVGVNAAALNVSSLANHGGPTQTMALGSGSVAIGHAGATVCQAAPIANLDQRGSPRNAGTRTVCDVGAYDTGGGGPTAAYVSRVRVFRHAFGLLFTWRLVDRSHVTGFALYAGAHRLSARIIAVRDGANYHFTYCGGLVRAARFVLRILLRDGSRPDVPFR